MAQTNHFTTPPIHSASLTKRMLQGAAIALVLIIIFVSGVDEPHPEWPKLWMVRPLLVVPIAGAMGGVFYYFMDHMRYLGGWKTILAHVLSLIGYLIALWLGTVLGLDGTMWN